MIPRGTAIILSENDTYMLCNRGDADDDLGQVGINSDPIVAGDVSRQPRPTHCTLHYKHLSTKCLHPLFWQLNGADTEICA